MTVRKLRVPKKMATELDSFGTPPAARSSMMCVAGDEESDQPLLTDEGDDTVMKGPVYDEGRRIRISVGTLRSLVRSRLA
jgi:hypothetical protein